MNKCALIGYGYWGKRFLRYIQEKFDVKYAYGRTIKEGGIFTNDIDKIWNDKEVDSVVIATPIDTHYFVAKTALLHGKNVFCEKPLAQSSSEIIRLNEIATSNGLALATEFTYTFSKSLKTAQELVNNGVIGELQAMDLSLKYVGKFLKFDVYWLLASHLLSVLDMFVPISMLNFRKINFIDKETGIILFDGAIKGEISVSVNYPDRETKVIAYGSEGTMVYDGLSQPSLLYILYRKLEGALANELVLEDKNYFFDEFNNLMYAVEYFRDVLAGNEQTNLTRALCVTKVLENFK